MSSIIQGSVVLVTGAAGGVGQALIPALQARGAVKIYAAGRECEELPTGANVVPLVLDVTQDEDVMAAAVAARDVTILVNNAGVNRNISFMTAPSLDDAREEIETNYLAIARMARAFAPTLVANQGMIVNILAALARINFPFMGSYCASKAAALSLTQGLRGELAPRGVRVVAALPSAIDTRMTASVDVPKMTPDEAVLELLDGIEAGHDEIDLGEMARTLARDLLIDPRAVEREVASWS